jgi:hypothetical protein
MQRVQERQLPVAAEENEIMPRERVAAAAESYVYTLFTYCLIVR